MLICLQWLIPQNLPHFYLSYVCFHDLSLIVIAGEYTALIAVSLMSICTKLIIQMVFTKGVVILMYQYT